MHAQSMNGRVAYSAVEQLIARSPTWQASGAAPKEPRQVGNYRTSQFVRPHRLSRVVVTACPGDVRGRLRADRRPRVAIVDLIRSRRG